MTHPTPDLRAIVDASRGGDDPDRDDRARVRGALIAKLGATAFVTGAAATTTSTAVASSLAASAAPYLVALALTSAVGVGAVASWRAQRSPPARPAITATHVSPRPARVERPPPAAPIAAPSPVVAPVVAAPSPVVDDPRPAPRTRPSHPAGEGIDSVPLEEAPDLVAETAALREAHVAMEAGDPERALRVLEGYATQHHGGALRVEREAARLIAQCQLGRARELEVTSFMTHHASSPLAARVSRACVR